MPRSFLVRQYFRRKYYWLIDDSYDEDEENEANRFISNYIYGSHYGDSAGNAASFAPVEHQTWNYEQEKSYWFEVNEQRDKKLNRTDVEHVKSLYQGPNGTDLLVEETASNALSIKTETDLQTSDNLAHDNLDEKLNQMLQENPDIVKKNIKQFLENNRILLKEISVEVGINEDSIKLYIDGNESFSKEQKEEFYRWYLLKILRPPSGLDEKSFTCYKCGKIFAYESYLERHIKYVCPDNTGRTWKCSYCGKAFQYPCYLKRHIRSHTGESPYKCDQCDRAFVRSTDLQRHIRNHTGEKPYKCSECERAFARSTDLKRHMRTHTGEKPYKCWQCGKTFSQSGSLQTHLHTHNKDNNGGRKLAKGSK